jgi:hypothetical protein
VQATGGSDYGEFPTNIGRIEDFDTANCVGFRISIAGQFFAENLSRVRVLSWLDGRMMLLEARR